jgi:hypothetical protein
MATLLELARHRSLLASSLNINFLHLRYLVAVMLPHPDILARNVHQKPHDKGSRNLHSIRYVLVAFLNPFLDSCCNKDSPSSCWLSIVYNNLTLEPKLRSPETKLSLSCSITTRRCSKLAANSASKVPLPQSRYCVLEILSTRHSGPSEGAGLPATLLLPAVSALFNKPLSSILISVSLLQSSNQHHCWNEYLP